MSPRSWGCPIPRPWCSGPTRTSCWCGCSRPFRSGRCACSPTDGEFHSFRRQAARWAESGAITFEKVAVGPGFSERLVERAASGAHDLIFVSQLMYGSGRAFDRIAELAALARPEGPWW